MLFRTIVDAQSLYVCFSDDAKFRNILDLSIAQLRVPLLDGLLYTERDN